ncbi:MAG: ABC transporter permease subunit [Proteobacteria bacterium]|nr:ABC transporter permease subunit [Pseudomonadota bacterium]
MSAMITIAWVALVRLVRGRALWIALVMALLPIGYALVVRDGGRPDLPADLFAVEQLLLVVVPPMLLAAAIGDELEDRTTAYLWSRPVPRWSVLAGKLVALAPIAIVLVLASWIVAGLVGSGSAPPLGTVAALAAGGLVIAIVAMGLATLVPKHGIALTVTYFLFLDLPIGALPASLRYLSVTHHVRTLAGTKTAALAQLDPQGPAVLALALIACGWSAIALWRIRRIEA